VLLAAQGFPDLVQVAAAATPVRQAGEFVALGEVLQLAVELLETLGTLGDACLERAGVFLDLLVEPRVFQCDHGLCPEQADHFGPVLRERPDGGLFSI